MKIPEPISGIVVRARNGDQNAAAHIALIREGMLRGEKAHQKQFNDIIAYIEANPMEGSGLPGNRVSKEAASVLGQIRRILNGSGQAQDTSSLCAWLIYLPSVGGNRAMDVAALFLANSRELCDGTLTAYANAIRDEGARAVFCEALLDCVDDCEVLEEDQAFLYAGRALGRARAIQRVRDPSNPIDVYSQRGACDYGSTEDDNEEP
jgi:hypothetical protein